MGEVITLEKPDTHLSGEAICSSCKREWMAVVPVGTVDLECPSCGSMKGLLRYPVAPPVSEIWQCDCGSDLFYIARDLFWCRECGVEQRF